MVARRRLHRRRRLGAADDDLGDERRREIGRLAVEVESAAAKRHAVGRREHKVVVAPRPAKRLKRRPEAIEKGLAIAKVLGGGLTLARPPVLGDDGAKDAAERVEQDEDGRAPPLEPRVARAQRAAVLLCRVKESPVADAVARREGAAELEQRVNDCDAPVPRRDVQRGVLVGCPLLAKQEEAKLWNRYDTS